MSNYFENEKLTLKEWCQKVTQAGHELTICWEGGGDSGWTHFEIDGEEEDNVYTRALVDYAYDVLDYGSWAGEFNAAGSAAYNPETNEFSGVDDYSEDATLVWKHPIQIKIPKIIWFDQLIVNIEDYRSTVKFGVNNGFLTDNHQILEKSLETDIQDEVDAAIAEFEKEYDFRYLSQDEVIERSEFTESEDGGYLVHTIESLSLGYSESTEKDFYLEVNETAENYLQKHLENEQQRK